MAAPAYDLITMGRIGVDIYPQSDGPLESVTSFARSLGGTATNVAVAAARLGRGTAVITKVGDDPFGRYAVAALHGFGVDTALVSSTPHLPTPVVFAELDPPEEPRIWFYRYPKAPDMMLTVEDLDLEALRDAAIFWATGTGLSDEPSLTATMEALSLRDPDGTTVLDLDWRPMLWPAPEGAPERYRAALARASVVVGNRSEVAVAVGELEPEEAAAALLRLGPRLAIVKLGGGGVLVATEAGSEVVPPIRVEVVNGLGAGDAFGGALCHRLLAGADPATAVRFANAAGAHVVARLACADAMPTEAEVLELLEASHAG
ncbi:MAG TPA: 5-dehydro-2-deoxygluconokinase [Gaiellales bacterium]|nr:5-dehydro-2-deoxygluconokinase [Gaiellales bacterium]